MACKYFLPSRRLTYPFIDYFLCCEEVFSFDAIPLVYFQFVACALVSHQEIIAKTNIVGLFKKNEAKELSRRFLKTNKWPISI